MAILRFFSQMRKQYSKKLLYKAGNLSEVALAETAP